MTVDDLIQHVRRSRESGIDPMGYRVRKVVFEQLLADPRFFCMEFMHRHGIVNVDGKDVSVAEDEPSAMERWLRRA